MLDTGELKRQFVTLGYIIGGFFIVSIIGGVFNWVAYEYTSVMDIMVAYSIYLFAVAHFQNSWITAILGFLGGTNALTEGEPLNPVFIGILSAIMLGGFWVSYSRLESDKWGPTEVEEETDEGWVLAYQESKYDEEKRWVGAKREENTVYCLDGEGNIREDNYFFDDRQGALQAIRKYSDPLNEPKFKKDKKKKVKQRAIKWGRFASKLGKVGIAIIVLLVFGAFMVGFVSEFVDDEPEPRVVSLDQPSQSTYEVTVQNSGGSGGVEVELYWIPENQSYPNANYPQNPEQAGFELHGTRAVQFNQGERRSVEFNGEMPEWSGSYYFRVQRLESSE